MDDYDFAGGRDGLSALPRLLRVLSPLRSVADPAALARAVCEWVVGTVACGCQLHLSGDRGLTTLVDLHDGPAPGPGVVEKVVATLEAQVVLDIAPGRAWVVLPLGGRRPATGAPSVPMGALSVLVDCPPEALTSSHRRGLALVAATLAKAMSEAMAQVRANQVSQALQASLLPGDLPEADWFELTARYFPGTADLRIGGDWYDSQVMADGTVALGVGDVAGHGVEAAARMGELRSAMVALRLVRSAPSDLISVVHRLASDMSCFATAVCARLDPTGYLQWASAGHLPPVVIHKGGEAEILRTNQSPPLGVGEVAGVPLNRFRLELDDTVLLYTDGLVERRDRSIEDSLEALVASVRHPHSSLAELVDEAAGQKDHPFSTGDDVAILAARWRGTA
jgi:Stage II sporulation protein E (SpoIIE)